MYALCTFLFVLGTVLTQIAFATLSKSKYLRFSNQKAATFTKATNYATLQSGGSDVISSKRFTLCGSIYIGFFRGYQAFYTVRKNDQRTLWFSVGLSLCHLCLAIGAANQVSQISGPGVVELCRQGSG